MTASVNIGAVTLTYKGASGGVLALQGTTLSVRRGEFAAVVGPAGCGKSSLMKLVTGLVPPTGRNRHLRDKVRGSVKIAGMAFQNANLLPWRKVIDNVLFSRSCGRIASDSAGTRRDREQASALLEDCGLDGFADRFPGNCLAACSSACRSAAR